MKLKQQLEELNELLGIDMNEYISSIKRGLVHNGLPYNAPYEMRNNYGAYYQVISTSYTTGKLNYVHANAIRSGRKIFQSDKFEHMSIAVEYFEKDSTTRVNIGEHAISWVHSSVKRDNKVISLEFNGRAYDFDDEDSITLINIEIGKSLKSLFKVDTYKEEFLNIIKVSHRTIDYDIKKWYDDYEFFAAEEVREETSPNKVTRLYYKDKPKNIGVLDYFNIHPSENSEYHGKILIFGYTSLKSILKQTELPDIIEIEDEGEIKTITKASFVEKYPGKNPRDIMINYKTN